MAGNSSDTKYLNLTGLTTYNTKIKLYITSTISSFETNKFNPLRNRVQTLEDTVTNLSSGTATINDISESEIEGLFLKD